jgi:cysteinyl-tRNA synthetase
MKWPSPWGDGFPGWHVECSAMSMKYLGDRFDVHTGGTDLRFPHHEDEIAQSEGAVGHQVVSTWVHGGFLQLTGQKIAKSTGNVIRAPELIERGLDPLAFRWLTFQTRYRSQMDFTWEAMATADQRIRQLRRHVAEWGEPAAELGPAAKEADARFREALADDLDMPTVVRIVNDLDHTPDVPPAEKRALLASWDHVLGLDLARDAEAAWEPDEAVRRLVSERDAARAAKDYASSDRLRDELQAMGLEVMDTAEGTKVRPR